MDELVTPTETVSQRALLQLEPSKSLSMFLKIIGTQDSAINKARFEEMQGNPCKSKTRDPINKLEKCS